MHKSMAGSVIHFLRRILLCITTPSDPAGE